ncbi:VanZ family protein [Halomicrobium salinisoli]|uniref:VanZ family protein n=1 Tax=Halomicrobium salinisoli TaxID=2878391 RepID=UPI001CF0ACEF|nr:VanZ family protein [Halomicrobium salinisoli]
MDLVRASEVPAPTRYTLAGGFAVAVALASILHAPDPIANDGPLGLLRVDKWIHVGSYALLTYLLAFAVLAERARVFVVIALASVAFGGGVELVQSTIPWRTMEFADVVANSAGTVVAIGAWRATWATEPVARSSLSD